MLHLKMIFRSWWRSGLSTIISLVSLVVGLVCSMTLILFVLGEYKIANALGDTDRVYLLEDQDVFFEDGNVRSATTHMMLGPDIADRFGDVERVAVVDQFPIVYDQQLNSRKEMYRVTPDFIEMFDIPVKEGDLQKTMSSASEIAVTESFIQDIYGRPAILGETVVGTTGGYNVNGEKTPVISHTYTITTILDENQKTPLNYGALASISIADIRAMDKGVSFNSFFTFVQLTPQSTPEQLMQKFAADSVFQTKSRELSLRPFSQVYLDGDLRSENDGFINRRDPSLLNIGLLISLAVLLIAAFNYINITMTRARGRLKNIAGQRIFGASKWAVRWQTVLDTTMLVLLSFAVALLVLNAISGQFNAFMDCNISVADLLDVRNLMTIVALLATLILLPSLYILIKIEVSSPMETFKNPLGKNVRISSMMVIAQFVISVVLIAVSINISRQMNFIANQRPGADKIIALRHYGAGQGLPTEFVDKIKSMSWVESFSLSSPLPNMSIAQKGHAVCIMATGVDVLDFYDMKLIEGRLFDEHEASGNVIVNEALLRTFEIERPAVGREFDFFDKQTIIGVVEDFIYTDAHKNIQPLIIQTSTTSGSIWQIYLKVNGNSWEHIEQIRNIWQEMYPQGGSIEQIKTIAQIYEEMHPQDQRLLTMVEIFMCFSMLLTVIGLFGLAFYSVGRRTKEIAVRKIHGSTTGRVILLLCRTFAVWVGVAFAVAVPIAYYLSREWLSTFIYHVPITAWVFLATAGVAALVTFVTVIFQTWSAASANPAKSIKTE